MDSVKKTTITIGIPAYNEQQNIKELLLSLFNQKLGENILKEIIVYSDVSTDRTHEIVEKLGKKYPFIKLIKGRTRKGKYALMNEMFVDCKTDVLIVMDADIAMVGDKFIQTLAMKLCEDKNAQMVSARNIFIRQNGFMANLIYTYFSMWDSLLLTMPGVDAGMQFSGTVTAFRGSYARSLRIPNNVHNKHMFLYLAAKKVSGFRFCLQAEVLQLVPVTVDEVKTLLVRDIVKPDEELDKMFGKDVIAQTQFVPRKAKLGVVLKSFVINPLYTPLALLFTFYIGRLSRKAKRSNTQLWAINTSTKKPIALQK